MHVEVVTNIIPGFNDDDRELRGIASWIKISLGEDTPWHVTRFYPHLHLSQGVPNAAQKFQGLSPFK
jgi:pyruvate formate lyase activating enzyme